MNEILRNPWVRLIALIAGIVLLLRGLGAAARGPHAVRHRLRAGLLPEPGRHRARADVRPRRTDASAHGRGRCSSRVLVLLVLVCVVVFVFPAVVPPGRLRDRPAARLAARDARPARAPLPAPQPALPGADGGDAAAPDGGPERESSRASSRPTPTPPASPSPASSGFVLAVLHLLVIPVFTLYLLHDMNHIQRGLAELVPPRHRPYVYSRMGEVDRRLSAFARGLVIPSA